MFFFKKKKDERCIEESCNDEYINYENEESINQRFNKPPNLREIGRATWLYLHSMANKYPDNPSSDERQKYNLWIKDFSDLYPCKICRESMKDMLIKSPPRLNNKKEFVLWLCEFHNMVNKKLGLKFYKCDYDDLIKTFNN